MCDLAETSREHAPPSSFFPETKIIGRDLRRNLVTVPSCDLHNSSKSKDDEFLRSVILMSEKNNAAGKHLFFGKLLRAVKRSPLTYGSFFLDKGTIGQGKDRVLQLDRDRFDRCIDHIARALFFDCYKRKWLLPISVTSPNFFGRIQSDSIIPHHLNMNAVDISREFLRDEPIRGENPDVFKYRLRYEEATDSYALGAIFYDHFEVFTFSSKALADEVM
jgi:hypothetical protein